MKELSIEEKAKRYDEAIEKLRSLHDDYDTVSTLIDVKEELENIFPELKESENKRMIQYFKDLAPFDKADELYEKYGFSHKDAISWLEKKGGHAKFINGIQVGDKVTRNEDGVLVNLSQLKRVAKKQGEQKPADKVEPKFHQGEWITNGYYTLKIVEVNPLDYILLSQDGNIIDDTISHVDEQFQSFTIQDAKDGDVLAVEHIGRYKFPFIAIYKNYGLNFFNSYCSIGFDGKFYEADTEHVLDDIHPATKEQRDLLFQKMKEAGYEWNAEKKELKKIEQKPTKWHREDEQNLNACLGYIPDEFLRRWLQDAIHTRYDKPAAWSEEDEKIINNLLWIIEAYRKNGFNEMHTHVADISENWLKALKDRYTWKPSESDIRILEQVIDGIANPLNYHTTLHAILEKLKKLREE